MAKVTVKTALWGLVVGNIESMGILPALQGGETIVRHLEGEGVLEKLAEFDGDDNHDVEEAYGFKYVILKACPFAAVYRDIPEWGEKSTRLVEAYNKKADGGGALHPLCLVHKGLRTAMKAGIISVACRSGATGKVEIAEKAMASAGLTEADVVRMIDGKACLIALKDD